MTVTVVWWLDTDDGAVHAFPRMQVGRGQAVLMAMCQRPAFAFRVERHGDGPRCLACRMLVGPN